MNEQQAITPETLDTSKLPSTMDPHTTQRRPRTRVGKRGGKLACDQCKFRKIKCDLSKPCFSCANRDFECTYSNSRQRKARSGRRIEVIQQSQNIGGNGQVSQSSTPLHVSSSQVLEAQRRPEPTLGVTIQGNTAPDCAPANIGLGADIEYWLPNVLPQRDFTTFHPDQSFHDNLPWLTDQAFFLEPPWQPQQEENLSDDPTAVLSFKGPSPISWPQSVTEQSLLPWIDIFFSRLHLTLPVLDQLAVYRRIIMREHLTDPYFASMILSLCAVSLTQPVRIHEQASSSSRDVQAKFLMSEAARLHSMPELGEDPSIESVLTSFFMFACLYGSNQNNAAWLRLGEAVDIAVSMGIHQSETYKDLPAVQCLQRLRIYLVLVITERGYALKRHKSIKLKGQAMLCARSILDLIPKFGNDNSLHPPEASTQYPTNARGLDVLLRMVKLFNLIDEEIIRCWNGDCSLREHGFCAAFDRLKAVTLQREIAMHATADDRPWNCCSESCRCFDGSFVQGHGCLSAAPARSDLEAIQTTDYMIAIKWLGSRLWALSSTHGLLVTTSQYFELEYRHAFKLADETIEMCERFSFASLEAHGIGLIERLFNIFSASVSAAKELLRLENTRGFTELEESQRILHICHKAMRLMSIMRSGNHPYASRFESLLQTVPGLAEALEIQEITMH